MQQIICLYGCGFNGFSQLDNFTQICGFNRDGSTNVQDHNPQGKHRNTVDCPKYLLKLHKNECVLHRLAITWNRIGITLQDDRNCFKSFVSGLNSSERPSSKSVTEGFGNQIAIASTDCCLLMNSTAESRQYLMLKDSRMNNEPLKINLQGDSKIQDICGGHTDIFVIYDTISFGKLSVRASISENKETKGLDRDQSMISFDIVPIDSGMPIQEISCGKEHTLFLSRHGSLYSYGLGSRGQLGHSNVEAESSPRLIEALEGVKMITVSAGGWHSAAVSEIGDLYVWGWNESGQLGISSSAGKNKETHLSSSEDEGVGIQSQPCCIDLPGDLNVTQVSCGSRHTVLLTNAHKAFTSGWNAYGQLGLGHTESRDTFTAVTALENPCIKIYAGQWNTFFVCDTKE